MKKLLLKKFRATSLIILLFTNLTHAQVDSALILQLQQILNKRVQTYGDHGVSACVIMPDGGTWKGTAGVGQGSMAISDTTVFHGASITKCNVATLMLLLAEDGLINLDSSWHKYITLNVAFNPSITIRQLLSHTSGIKDYLEVQGSGTLVTSDFNHAFTPTEILENIVSGTPNFAPGTNFKYSTSNYVLAALIAQTVTGHPVQQELRSRIWAPLGMKHTYFGGFESYNEARAGMWWDFESGLQDYSNDPETAILTYGYGGANIVSTPGDLAIFARALLTGTLLTPSSLSQMKTISPNSSAYWAGYGLGLHHAMSYPTANMFGHDGFYSNLSDMFHNEDLGFTLVSMSNTETQYFAIFNQLYNAVRNYIKTVGIPENKAEQDIHIFPNPVNASFVVDLGERINNANISILDLSGKIIFSKSVDTSSVEIDTENFSEGVYIIKIQAANFTGRKKLVITK